MGEGQEKEEKQNNLSKTKTLRALMHMRTPKINIKGDNFLWVCHFSV